MVAAVLSVTAGYRAAAPNIKLVWCAFALACLLGMQERASVLGGKISLTPNQPEGTRVILRLPRMASEARLWAEL